MLEVAGGAPDGILCEHEEGSASALASEWLIEYRRLALYGKRVAEGDTGAAAVSALVRSAENLGRLGERMWWRHGVDRETAERREDLGVREKAAVKYRRAGGAANAIAAVPRRAQAHRLAREIVAKRTRPMSGRALAAAVVAAWPQDDDSPPSFGTVRKYLSNFRGHGLTL
jgi:hypothetical protein